MAILLVDHDDAEARVVLAALTRYVTDHVAECADCRAVSASIDAPPCGELAFIEGVGRRHEAALANPVGEARDVITRLLATGAHDVEVQHRMADIARERARNEPAESDWRAAWTASDDEELRRLAELHESFDQERHRLRLTHTLDQSGRVLLRLHWKRDHRLPRLRDAARFAFDFYRLGTPEFVTKYGAGYTTRDAVDRLGRALGLIPEPEAPDAHLEAEYEERTEAPDLGDD